MQDTRMISLAARGAWMDLLCAMWRSQNRGQVTSTVAGFARLFGCTVEQAEAVIDEITDAQVCNAVTERDGKVTLINRRMDREAKEREGANLRQERYRDRKRREGDASGDAASDTEVTPPSSSSSSSSSSTSKKELASPAKKPRALPKLPDDEYLEVLQADPAYAKLEVRHVFAKMSVWCTTRGKQPTRRRLVDWLNREDQPITTNGNGNKPHAPTPFECRTCRNTGMITGCDPADGYKEITRPCGCEYGTLQRRSA